MQLLNNEVQLFRASLNLSETLQKEKMSMLSMDEVRRAERFYFPIHQMRYIAARAALREILATYLNCSPKKIIMHYDEHQKPYQVENMALKFNLSHSENLVIYSFTLNHPIGIDIEKVKPNYQMEVAARYFSEHEMNELQSLDNESRTRGFYRLWAKKEALVKAIGKGLACPLASFTVSIEQMIELIHLDNQSWKLIPLTVHNDYESALAANPCVNQLTDWQWTHDTSSKQLLQKRHLS